MRTSWVRGLVTVALLVAWTASAGAAEITLLSAGAVRAVASALAESFTKETGSRRTW